MTIKALYQGPIFVQKSPIHGYGVFATEAIEKGALIEECHTLVMADKNAELMSYYFNADDRSTIPLGFGCIYNHSNTPNITYCYQPDTGLMVFTALMPIKAGEELCSSYGKDWFASRDLKVKAIPLWRQIYQLSSGLLFRAGLVFLALWSVINGIKYFGAM